MGLPYSLDQSRVLDAKGNSDNLLTTEAPGVLAGPLVWSGADFKDNQAYTLQLNKEDIAEIDSALTSFKSQRTRQYWNRNLGRADVE